MGGFQTSILADAGIDAGESSIGSRLVSQQLYAMAADMGRMLKDGRVTPTELRRFKRHTVTLARQARAAEEAADLGASASNKCGVAEQRILHAIRMGGDVRRALYLTADRGNHSAERAAGVVVLSDFKAGRSDISAGPDDGETA